MVGMKDIAAAAGVSQSTVSLVLSGRYQKDLKISDEVAKRVKETAARMQYRRNAVAGAMKQGRTNIIGFIGNLGEPGHNYVLNMINGISKTLQHHNYLLKMFSLDGTDFSEICKNCVEQRLCGVIARFLTAEQLELLHKELSPYQIPVVILGNSFHNDWYPRVISDDVTGCILAVRHLAGLGHKKIGFLTKKVSWNVFLLRGEGYLEGMREQHLTALPDDILYLPQDQQMEDSDYLVFDAYYQKIRPTAVICASDALAMKLLAWAHTRKIEVPEQLSVIGYGNIDNSGLTSPPLTTVAHPYEQMGTRSAEMMLAQIEKNEQQNDEILPINLIIRNSTDVCLKHSQNRRKNNEVTRS